MPAAGNDAAALRAHLTSKATVVEAQNLFEVLGLAPAASKEEIRRAYFDAAKKYHPDRLAAAGLEALHADVEKIFRRVGEAYAVLSDDARRAQYIASLTGDGDGEGRAKATRIVEAELAQTRSLSDIVRGVTDPAVKKDLYVLAFAIVRADETVSGAERIYLAQLAHQLGLDPAAVQAIEAETANKIDSQSDS